MAAAVEGASVVTVVEPVACDVLVDGLDDVDELDAVEGRIAATVGACAVDDAACDAAR
jgi:hypothetical protein